MVLLHMTTSQATLAATLVTSDIKDTLQHQQLLQNRRHQVYLHTLKTEEITPRIKENNFKENNFKETNEERNNITSYGRT